MKREPLPKAYRAKAETAAVHYAKKVEHCYVTRKASRARFNEVDFFASDVMGKRENGSTVYIQVTCGNSQKVKERMLKLEKHAWNVHEDVLMLQLNRKKEERSFKYYFSIWRYVPEYSENYPPLRKWTKFYEGYDVPQAWFKKE